MGKQVAQESGKDSGNMEREEMDDFSTNDRRGYLKGLREEWSKQREACMQYKMWEGCSREEAEAKTSHIFTEDILRENITRYVAQERRHFLKDQIVAMRERMELAFNSDYMEKHVHHFYQENTIYKGLERLGKEVDDFFSEWLQNTGRNMAEVRFTGKEEISVPGKEIEDAQMQKVVEWCQEKGHSDEEIFELMNRMIETC